MKQILKGAKELIQLKAFGSIINTKNELNEYEFRSYLTKFNTFEQAKS
tara:strand:- start:37 stop:180 length:144 start_codon:yes stop_codon:yes gene_type:complete